MLRANDEDLLTEVDARNWRLRTMVLLCGLLVLRVATVYTSPLELCADEAYYWDWSRQLDWGYYSKPPMVAWLIAAATWLGGPHEWVIRMPAAVLGTLGLWPVSRLAERMFDARVGFWSALAVAATPGVTAMSMLMTIDAPFLCAWAFSLWFVWEVISVDDPDWKWVLAAILSTGFGLLSKQTMIAIFPLAAFWLCVHAETRPRLGSFKVWAWWLGSLACLAPVIWWNAHHEWITLIHTSEHFQQRTASWWQQLVRCVEFWISQLGIVSPVTATLAIAGMICGVRVWRRLDPPVQYLMCCSAVPMAGVFLLSTTQRVQPNWPAGFLLAAIVIAAAWSLGKVPQLPRKSQLHRSLYYGVAIGAMTALVTLGLPWLGSQHALAGSKFDPTARLRGWKHLGTALGQMPALAASAELPLVIAHTGRGPVSLLAYYTPGQPRVYRWTTSGRIVSQHDVWGGPAEDVRGRDAIIVTPVGVDLPSELEQAFDVVVPLGTLSSQQGRTRQERIQVWQGIALRDWPALPPTRTQLAAAAKNAGRQTFARRMR